ncbi:MAG: DUF447 family protein [Candidatus Altiarchaeota archaeon]|nr:DUF447 family protein [Candidatus Altiarchaeota archaeon]
MLEKLGLEKGWIYEVIMETRSKDGAPNIAPMGVWTVDSKFLLADIYEENRTYKNLMAKNEGSVYFVRDPKYFVDGKIERIPWDAKLEFRVARVECKNPCRFYLEITGREVRGKPEPINRARGLFIEFLIDYSRKGKDEAARARLDYYKKAVSKVAPGSDYERITGGLYEDKG